MKNPEVIEDAKLFLSQLRHFIKKHEASLGIDIIMFANDLAVEIQKYIHDPE